MDRTVPITQSPLGQQLQQLVDAGIVRLNQLSINDFPSARVVVPVFDSAGTFMPNLTQGQTTDAKLARSFFGSSPGTNIVTLHRSCSPAFR